MSAAIELERVTAGYRDRPVLNDISFAIEAGEMTAVIGPNGAGKTTLLRVVTGLVKPISGHVRLFGQAVPELRARDRARLVGVVSQSLETPMAFTVEEMVTMGRTRVLGRWMPPSARDRECVRRAMEWTDVSVMRARRFTELSGGEKQRAVIAMVLAQEPQIILMDEPTSHLDMNHRVDIMQIVERMNTEHGVTVLVVSHDLNLSADFCRRLVMLDHGRIRTDGPPVDVLTEDILEAVYHGPVRVHKDPEIGSVSVTPLRRPTPSDH